MMSRIHDLSDIGEIQLDRQDIIMSVSQFKRLLVILAESSQHNKYLHSSFH